MVKLFVQRIGYGLVMPQVRPMMPTSRFHLIVALAGQDVCAFVLLN